MEESNKNLNISLTESRTIERKKKPKKEGFSKGSL